VVQSLWQRKAQWTTGKKFKWQQHDMVLVEKMDYAQIEHDDGAMQLRSFFINCSQKTYNVISCDHITLGALVS